METGWNNITRKHVFQALQEFNKTSLDYPQARNTYLVYGGKKYPAKHVRGIAFRIAHNKEIKKSKYSGGQETAEFFNKLGFDVEYRRSHIPSEGQQILKPTALTKFSVIDQKKELKELLRKHYGAIETEKKFEWLKTPDPKNLPDVYKIIVNGLIKYRNQPGFLDARISPACDMVIEQRKMIIEYDENQHFTRARKITLENYPESIETLFPKRKWIEQCAKINAKDNDPIDRDERRSYYDTVRDIESFRNGYVLIRIMHGEYDWNNVNAIEYFRELAEKKAKKHKIARLVLSGKQYHNGNGKPIFKEIEKVVNSFIQQVHPNKKYNFIVTPGGFLRFDWPKKFEKRVDTDLANKMVNMKIFHKNAEEMIFKFIENIGSNSFSKLKHIADCLTIGIDSKNQKNNQHIELIAIFDLKESKVIHWTGKFYPTGAQEKDLITINNLKSHFMKLNNQNILILGCHDLNVFNPRGQAIAKGWRKRISKQFKCLCHTFKPTMIIQHPHETDSPRIWNLAWKAIEKELPEVKHYASGIKYYCDGYNCRGTLSKVLEKTKRGDVEDFIFV